jgi:hypothetical protein
MVNFGSKIGAIAGGAEPFLHRIIILSNAHAVFLRCMYDARYRLIPVCRAAKLHTIMHSSERDLTTAILPCTLDKSVIDNLL